MFEYTILGELRLPSVSIELGTSSMVVKHSIKNVTVDFLNNQGIYLFQTGTL